MAVVHENKWEFNSGCDVFKGIENCQAGELEM